MNKFLKKRLALATVLAVCIDVTAADASVSKVFGDQLGEIEGLLTSGLFRIGLLAVCGISAAYCIVRQNVMGLVISFGGALAAQMMSTWIKSTFGALIYVV